MPVYPNFYQTLLPCPIVELRGYAAACGLQGKLYAYLDFGGPTGTSRDALAEGMLALAAERAALPRVSRWWRLPPELLAWPWLWRD